MEILSLKCWMQGCGHGKKERRKKEKKKKGEIDKEKKK